MSAGDSGPGDDGGRGSDLAMVALRLAASVVVYLLVEADASKLQALQMRLWHYTTRAAWRVSADTAALGLWAERRYNQIKG